MRRTIDTVIICNNNILFIAAIGVLNYPSADIP